MTDQLPNLGLDQPRQSGRRTRAILLVLAIVAIGSWVWTSYFQSYHFAAVREGVLYRDGNRGVREFATAVRKSGARTVVCLVDDIEMQNPDKPQFQQEVDLLKQQNVKLVRIPIQLGGWPSSDDVKKFLEIASDRTKQPVLVHCAQGVRRTGMLVAAFQLSEMGFDKPRATGAIQPFGHSERTITDVKTFIDRYDPATRTFDNTGLDSGLE